MTPADLIESISSSQWIQFADEYGLSPRELEVTRLSCADMKRKSIARRLGCTVGTVATHMRRIHAKTSVHTRGELVALVTGWYGGDFKKKHGKPR